MPDTPTPELETNHPTRRSLRESRSARPIRAKTSSPRINRPSAPRPTKGVGRRLTAHLAALVVVPALFGTIALPAFGTPQLASDAGVVTSAADAQSLIVGSEVTAYTVQRDSYSATTKQELVDAAAAAAAAAASRSRTGSGSTKNYNDADLMGFLGTTSQAWQRPVAASPTSAYGPRRIICNSAGCSTNFHDGVDLGTSCGTPIKAISAGRVVFVGSAGSYGNRVIVDHGGGVESVYGHVQSGSFKVSEGDFIEGGTPVASVGATGVVTDCVLDLKIRINGATTNPVYFLAGRGVNL